MWNKVRWLAGEAKMAAQVVRSTGVINAMAPRGLVQFARSAKETQFGPHLAVLYHASVQPEKEAVVEYGVDGSVRRLTWGELNATINRLGHALFARGVKGGDQVAVMLPNGMEYLIAQQALARVGATAVQIGYRLKAGEIVHILENAEPRATLVHAEYLAAMREARAQVKATTPMIVVGGNGTYEGTDADDWSRALAAASPDLPPRVRGGDGGGVIVYTSGTTGKPKGAKRNWNQTGIEAVADMILQCGMRSDDRHLVVCPLYHSAAPAFVTMMMSLGATIVLMNHFEAEAALRIIENEKITCSMMVPTMLVRMCALPAAVRDKYSTRSLRWVMSGAAPLSTETARQVLEQWGPVLFNFYGSTETGLVTIAGPLDHTQRPGTIGKAMRGNTIRLLDDDGKSIAVGGVGELYARNSTLMSGYHRNAEATSSAARDGFYSVGDLARVDADGFYYLESRKHDMVISGGVNIYPREIEDHLQTHPAILEAAVVGIPDAEWGETLKAFIVRRDGQTITDVEVIEYCRSGLADYKRPRKVVFLAELPRNPTGKVLKRDLRDA
jgi:fatty-acyl-CoA synthase